MTKRKPPTALMIVPLVSEFQKRGITIDKLDNADEKPGGRGRMCRYPERLGRNMTFYCGLPTGGTSSWCPYHRSIATHPPRSIATPPPRSRRY